MQHLILQRNMNSHASVHAAGDELGDLRAEIDNQDGVVGGAIRHRLALRKTGHGGNR